MNFLKDRSLHILIIILSLAASSSHAMQQEHIGVPEETTPLISINSHSINIKLLKRQVNYLDKTAWAIWAGSIAVCAGTTAEAIFANPNPSTLVEKYMIGVFFHVTSAYSLILLKNIKKIMYKKENKCLCC
jgi:hypothetical protein